VKTDSDKLASRPPPSTAKTVIHKNVLSWGPYCRNLEGPPSWDDARPFVGFTAEVATTLAALRIRA